MSFERKFNQYEVVADPSGAYVMVELTRNQWTICDLDDWFSVLCQHKWYAAWDRTTKTYYAKAQIKRDGITSLCVNMNRVVLGATSKYQITDHRDHDTLNNRRVNLRIASRAHSACNRRRFSNSTTSYIGVSFDKAGKNFIAYIDMNKKRTNLGRFSDPVVAAKARDEAAIRMHGEFAVLNFPKDAAVPA